ncbi:hypothetical protein [Coleofasciculus sp. E1-EBD-02]|uniref:hypothetical protein n=1 Tax=Coleofasciculus sp. E1-EBD-02 TaxID=3068481 RepID=UPI0032F42FD4
MNLSSQLALSLTYPHLDPERSPNLNNISNQLYLAHVCGNRRTGSEGRTSVRHYVRVTNGAIAGCSYSHQFYRAHVYAPLRAGEKRCDRLFPSGQLNRAIAALFPASANLVPSPSRGGLGRG